MRRELTLMGIRNKYNDRWDAMYRNIKRFENVQKNKHQKTQKKQQPEKKDQSVKRGENVILKQVKIEPADSDHKGKQQVQGTVKSRRRNVKPPSKKCNVESVKRSRW